MESRPGSLTTIITSFRLFFKIIEWKPACDLTHTQAHHSEVTKGKFQKSRCRRYPRGPRHPACWRLARRVLPGLCLSFPRRRRRTSTCHRPADDPARLEASDPEEAAGGFSETQICLPSLKKSNVQLKETQGEAPTQGGLVSGNQADILSQWALLRQLGSGIRKPT
ncbi:Ubiquitin Carboxyl-Terminal Hydrolase 35 [Manis pentadactyla]|nr:Ubiquitin Carboxyl-Terminal Hydrolase 35 [Manis pentadactyla]